MGSRLPTVRRLAADLGIAPGTVGRAFRELEVEGILESRGRHGTHVKGPPRRPQAAERGRRIRDAAAAYAAVPPSSPLTPRPPSITSDTPSTSDANG